MLLLESDKVKLEFRDMMNAGGEVVSSSDDNFVVVHAILKHLIVSAMYKNL